MPIEYRIDHARQVVLATGHGTLTDEDLFGYHHDVWSRSDVVGYDELVDLTAVERIALPSLERVGHLAEVSAASDPRAFRSKFAIVAPQEEVFGLSRMFEVHRSSNEQSTKQVAVFRTRAEAIAFLGFAEDPQS